jgi:heterodisulfide reductase subunit A-like polyferredoxin
MTWNLEMHPLVNQEKCRGYGNYAEVCPSKIFDLPFFSPLQEPFFNPEKK